MVSATAAQNGYTAITRPQCTAICRDFGSSWSSPNPSSRNGTTSFGGLTQILSKMVIAFSRLPRSAVPPTDSLSLRTRRLLCRRTDAARKNSTRDLKEHDRQLSCRDLLQRPERIERKAGVEEQLDVVEEYYAPSPICTILLLSCDELRNQVAPP